MVNSTKGDGNTHFIWVHARNDKGEVVMMNKSVGLLLGMGLLGAVVHADPILFWGSDTAFGSGSGVVYTDGMLVSQGTHWLVELIDTADDTVLHSTTNGFTSGDGLFFAAPDAAGWNGKIVKTVIYDAVTKELATYQAMFSGGAQLLSWNETPSPPSTFNYDAGIVTSLKGGAPGQWHVVPEPTVAALISVFGGGMLLSKRIFKKMPAAEDS